LASSIAGIPANLFLVAASRQVTHPYRCPAKIAHDFRQTSASAGSAAALEDFQVVEQCLRADSFDTIVTNSAAHARQAYPPRVSVPRRHFGLRFV
jgi:hypothetical protein